MSSVCFYTRLDFDFPRFNTDLAVFFVLCCVCVCVCVCLCFFCFQAEDGIRDLVRSRGLGDVYKRQDYYFYIETETIDKPGRVDYNFSWQTKNQNGLNYRLKVKIVGDKISLFQIQPIIPDQYNKSETDIFEVSTTIILTLLIIISISIVGFKRFRAYEVGFKHAIIFGLFVLISFILKAVSYTHLTLPTSDLV